MSSSFFIADPGFCSNCGTILPMLGETGGVKCYNCKTEFGPEDSNKKSSEGNKTSSDEHADGPLVERQCPKCGHNKMSYATLQLRSADEGQTVFYTCTKCRFKETENS